MLQQRPSPHDQGGVASRKRRINEKGEGGWGGWREKSKQEKEEEIDLWKCRGDVWRSKGVVTQNLAHFYSPAAGVKKSEAPSGSCFVRVL